LEWNIHPFKEEPLKSFFLLTFLFILMFLVFLISRNITFSLIAITAMIVSLRGFLFNTRYKLEAEVIHIKMLSFQYKKKYNDFKKLYIGKDAFLMSPFMFKTKLNKYRGVYIPFPENLKVEIINFISEKFEDVIITER